MFNLALKINSAMLKAEIDKIDIRKSKTVPVDLSKLSNVVNDDVVKKSKYDELLAKVNNIDISGFLLKTNYDTEKSDLEKKMNDENKKVLDINELVKKISELKGKIACNTGLTTTAALTIVENKILDVNKLVKKKQIMMQKYQKLSLILITIVIDYNKFSNKKVDLKIKQKGLVNKSDITGFINNADLDKKKWQYQQQKQN